MPEQQQAQLQRDLGLALEQPDKVEPLHSLRRHKLNQRGVLPQEHKQEVEGSVRCLGVLGPDDVCELVKEGLLHRLAVGEGAGLEVGFEDSDEVRSAVGEGLNELRFFFSVDLK